MIQRIYFLILFLLLSSCSRDKGSDTTSASGNLTPKLVFGGLSSVSSKTDSSIELHWSVHESADSYEVFDTKSGTPVLLTTVSGQATNSVILPGLIPDASYSFRVRIKTLYGLSDSNLNDINVVMAPVPPSILALHTLTASAAITVKPKLTISGVKSGDVIKLFTDSACSTPYVANGVASGSSIDLTSTPLEVGSHSFYATATNPALVTSACSTASVTYQRIACPTNFIPVPFNASVGTTSDFCVAKYEMKCVGSSCPVNQASANAVATSKPSGTSWTSISRTSDLVACSNLNAINGVSLKYFMITNAEWMTIARDIESVGENWSGSLPGIGVLARGHSDEVEPLPPLPPLLLEASSDDSASYFGTGNTSADAPNLGWEQKRTHTLSNGQVIWDLAGNAQEAVDWIVITKAHNSEISIETGQTEIWIDFKDINTFASETDQMKPSTWQPFYSSLTGLDGIGQYFSGTKTKGRSARRGGHYAQGNIAGIYNLRLSGTEGYVHSSLGFRCVYRP
jgi:hypothetical protein